MTRLSPGFSTQLRRGLSRHRAALVVVAFVVVTAGCAGFIGGDSADDSAPIEEIPAEADGLVHVQTAVLTDSVTESAMNDFIRMDAAEEADANLDNPESWADVLEELEEEADIDLDDIHSVTMFGGDGVLDEEEYAGFIVQSDLDWEDFEDAADEEVEADLEETSYNDVTVYVEDDDLSEHDSWVADFEDGTFAIGPEPVVRDVIDTREGDAPGIDDDLRSTFEDATEGYLTAAFTLTDEQSDVAGDIAAEEAGIGDMFIPEAEAVTMSYHTEDDRMNAEVDVVLQSAEDADTFTSFVEPIIEPPSVEENPDPDEQPFEWLVDQFTIDSDDDRVSLTFSADPDELQEGLEALDESDPLDPFDDEFAPGVGAVTLPS